RGTRTDRRLCRNGRRSGGTRARPEDEEEARPRAAVEVSWRNCGAPKRPPQDLTRGCCFCLEARTECHALTGRPVLIAFEPHGQSSPRSRRTMLRTSTCVKARKSG